MNLRTVEFLFFLLAASYISCQATQSIGNSTASQSQEQRDRAQVEMAMQSLWSAARRDDPAAVRAALDRGAELERRDSDGQTPLHIAAAMGHVRVIDELLRAGADLEAATNFGNRPLHRAAVNGRSAAVNRLAKAGADLQALGSGGWTALQMASMWGHRATADLLRSLGAL